VHSVNQLIAKIRGIHSADLPQFTGSLNSIHPRPLLLTLVITTLTTTGGSTLGLGLIPNSDPSPWTARQICTCELVIYHITRPMTKFIVSDILIAKHDKLPNENCHIVIYLL